MRNNHKVQKGKNSAAQSLFDIIEVLQKNYLASCFVIAKFSKTKS